jgi:uncharacterized protein (TIGR01777 family)
MATVMITGGTGMIGTALSEMLAENGYHVIILSRNPQKTAKEHDYRGKPAFFRSSGNIYYSKWDIDRQYLDPAALSAADYIVHLAGAGVADKRWTKDRKKEILVSRTQSSEVLVKALRAHTNKVRAVVSSSAIGWYGADDGKPFVETDPPAADFLGQTCKLWEQSILPLEELGIRLVRLRTGIVLSDEGGALMEFRKPLRVGAAAILGNGEQVISWIHIEDLCRIFMHAIEDKSVIGVYNAVAPQPVSNRQLTKTLAKRITNSRHYTLKVPAFVLKTVLGEMSVEVLKSTTVSSSKIEATGFNFRFPSLEMAIDDLY